MCVYSMVVDHYNDKWKKQIENLPPNTWPSSTQAYTIPAITKEEFEELKKDVAELKIWLKEALDYDERIDQSGCENDEKIETLKELAKQLGLDIEDVFK